LACESAKYGLNNVVLIQQCLQRFSAYLGSYRIFIHSPNKIGQRLGHHSRVDDIVDIEPGLISKPRKKSRQWIGPSNGMAWYRVLVLYLYISESPAQSHLSSNVVTEFRPGINGTHEGQNPRQSTRLRPSQIQTCLCRQPASRTYSMPVAVLQLHHHLPFPHLLHTVNHPRKPPVLPLCPSSHKERLCNIFLHPPQTNKPCRSNHDLPPGSAT
jgi:hypothetical protein